VRTCACVRACVFASVFCVLGAYVCSLGVYANVYPQPPLSVASTLLHPSISSLSVHLCFPVSLSPTNSISPVSRSTIAIRAPFSCAARGDGGCGGGGGRPGSRHRTCTWRGRCPPWSTSVAASAPPPPSGTASAHALSPPCSHSLRARE
jgi:hypothetical protein